MWQQWLNGVLGLWIILMPFFFGVDSVARMWTLIITGLLVAVLGFWGATQHAQMESRTHRTA